MELSETVRKAVILAGAKGYITLDQLNQILPPNLQSEDIENVMMTLSENGIWLRDE